MILQEDEKEMRELGMSGFPEFHHSASNSRTQSRTDSLGCTSRRGSLLPNPNPLPGMEPPTSMARRGSLAKSGSKSSTQALSIKYEAIEKTSCPELSHFRSQQQSVVGQLANLVMDEEAERRGARKVSLVMKDETAFVKDRRLAVSEGR